MTWTPGYSIRVSMFSTWSVFNLEIKFFHDFQPSRLLSNRIRCSTEPGEWRMIRPDFETSSQQVLLEIFQRVNDGQQLLSRYTVVNFSLV